MSKVELRRIEGHLIEVRNLAFNLGDLHRANCFAEKLGLRYGHEEYRAQLKLLNDSEKELLAACAALEGDAK